MHPDIEKELVHLLEKKKRDYLSISQVRSGLPLAVLRHLGLTRKSSISDVGNKLRPFLGGKLERYKGPRSVFIGIKKPLKDFILNGIRKKPGLSSKTLRKGLPMTKRDYFSILNELLLSGEALCTLGESHQPFIHIPDGKPSGEELEKPPTDFGLEFKNAYNEVGKGRDFVRIHRIREKLGWDPDHFDTVLAQLRQNYMIHLHGGDPSVMTEGDIENSFTDENGILYITLTWVG